MNAAKLKGSLLEFCIRRILLNCGFSSVEPDGVMIFRRGDLTMINGKGAAHDADVLMNPPIQMPFAYPFRINFECKSYKKTIGLDVIRNALGLRNDLNDFELVTSEHLIARQNNRRTNLAVVERQRFNYQIGVAAVSDFSKHAFEFAANNKIPLFSLSWFLPDAVCKDIHKISDQYISQFEPNDLDNLHRYFKGEEKANISFFTGGSEPIFSSIFQSLREFERQIVVGMLESGDMLFLIAKNGLKDIEFLENPKSNLNARFHYFKDQADIWHLSIDDEMRFKFYLPKSVMSIWEKTNYSASQAHDLKRKLFSKIFVFVSKGEYPFRILNIDKEWIDEISDKKMNLN